MQQAQLPGRKRALAFAGVLPVVGYIDQVVEQINTGGCQAKHRKSQQRCACAARNSVAVRGQQRDKDQQVFHPLVRSHGFEQGVGQCWFAVAKNLTRVALLTSGSDQATGLADHMRYGGALPDDHVSPVVADVVKAFFTVLGHQRGALGTRLEVGGGIGGQHLVKQIQVRGHLVCQQAVAGGGQHDDAALSFFLFQPDQQFLVVRQC